MCIHASMVRYTMPNRVRQVKSNHVSPIGLGLVHQLLCAFLLHLHPFLRHPGSPGFPQLHQVPQLCWLTLCF